MHQDTRTSAIRRFFAGLTEYAFHSRLGVADPPLVDYIAELLVRFVRWDELYPVRSVRGQRLMQVADMLAEAQYREGPARRQVHRHIGDYTLFWTGVFPEAVSRLRSTHRKDHLVDFCEQGKRSYYIASTFDEEPYQQEAPVLRQLSHEFELCSVGLHRVRKEWEQAAQRPWSAEEN